MAQTGKTASPYHMTVDRLENIGRGAARVSFRIFRVGEPTLETWLSFDVPPGSGTLDNAVVLACEQAIPAFEQLLSEAKELRERHTGRSAPSRP